MQIVLFENEAGCLETGFVVPLRNRDTDGYEVVASQYRESTNEYIGPFYLTNAGKWRGTLIVDLSEVNYFVAHVDKKEFCVQ